MTEKDLLGARPHSATEKDTKRSLADRMDGMTVQEAVQWVSQAKAKISAAPSAQGAAVAAPADQQALTKEAARAIFEGSNAGKAVRSDTRFLPSLHAQLQTLTKRSGATVEDLLTDMSEADARHCLDRALEILDLEVEQGELQRDQQNVDAMVQALGVTPMDVKGDGHCLYYALAKSADPQSKDDPEAAQKMRAELDERSSKLAKAGMLKPLGILNASDYFNSQVHTSIQTGLNPGPLNSRAWGGPMEMQVHAIANNRTVAFVSTNGGYLYTPDGERHHIRNPAAFRQELDIQAAEDKAKGHKPPLIVINRSDTHFQAAVYGEKPAASKPSGVPQPVTKASIKHPVPSNLVKHQAVLKSFMDFVNESQRYAESHPLTKAKQCEYEWRRMGNFAGTPKHRLDKAHDDYVDAWAKQDQPAGPEQEALKVARENLPAEFRQRAQAQVNAFDAMESALLDLQLADSRTTLEDHPIKSLMNPNTGVGVLVADLRRNFSSTLKMDADAAVESMGKGKYRQAYGPLGEVSERQSKYVQRLDLGIGKLQAAIHLDDARFIGKLDGETRAGIGKMMDALKALKAEVEHKDGMAQVTSRVFNAAMDGSGDPLTMMA